MNMVVHEDPVLDGTFCLLNVLSEAFKKPGFILCVAENIRCVDSPEYDIVEGAGNI
jgi:hypothetical protein